MIGLNSCEHYLEMMSAFMDGELDESLRAELSDHISACDDCFNASLAYKSINEAISDGEVTPPEDLCALVMAGIRSSAPIAPKAKKKLDLRHLGALAAAIVVVIVTAIAAPSMFKKGGNEAHDSAAPEDMKANAQYSTTLDGGDAATAPESPGYSVGDADGAASTDSDFLPDLPLYSDSSAGGVAKPTYTGYDGLMLIGPRPGIADADEAPAENDADEEIVLGDPISINGYDCSAIIVLDPAISPPDIIEQYAYFSWAENKDLYHIVSADLYDELKDALENIGLSYTLDLFSEIKADGWVLLITAIKE